MSSDRNQLGLAEWGVTRRDVLRSALAGGALLAGGGIFAACGEDSGGASAAKSNTGGTPATGAKSGGSLRVGATGGGAEDTIDAHKPTADTDIMRAWHLYESLAVRNARLHRARDAARRVDRGREQAGHVDRPAQARASTFHNGKPVTADDVIFSLRRIIDPKDPKVGAASIGYIDAQGAEEARRPHGPDHAAVRQRRLPRRPRPVLQRHRPGRLRPEEPGRHRPVQVPELHARRAERVRQVPRLLADGKPYARRAGDHRLPRRHRARQRAARRPGRGDRQPAGGQIAQRQGQPEPARADLRDRRVAAVHDARRRRRRSTTCACARRSG